MHIEKTITIIIIVIACVCACASVCTRRPQSNCGVSSVHPHISSLDWIQGTRLAELGLCPPGHLPALTGISRQWKSTWVLLSCCLPVAASWNSDSSPAVLQDHLFLLCMFCCQCLAFLMLWNSKWKWVSIWVGRNRAEPLVPGASGRTQTWKTLKKDGKGEGRVPGNGFFSLFFDNFTFI